MWFMLNVFYLCSRQRLKSIKMFSHHLSNLIWHMIYNLLIAFSLHCVIPLAVFGWLPFVFMCFLSGFVLCMCVRAADEFNFISLFFFLRSQRYEMFWWTVPKKKNSSARLEKPVRVTTCLAEKTPRFFFGRGGAAACVGDGHVVKWTLWVFYRPRTVMDVCSSLPSGL